MAFISITRLRLRSARFLPRFALHAIQSLRQVKRAPGFQAGSLLPDRRWTFWTLTAWDDQSSMKAYMTSGSHRDAMPQLLRWCDEASIAHWEQAAGPLPSWDEASRRMREVGRPSKVHKPSPQHANLAFQPPRLGAGSPITKSGKAAR